MASRNALLELTAWLQEPVEEEQLYAVDPVPRRLHGKQKVPEGLDRSKKRGRSATKDKGKSRRRHKAMKEKKPKRKPMPKKRAKCAAKRRPKYEIPDWRNRHWNPSLWKNNSHARAFERSILMAATEEMCSTLCASLMSLGKVVMGDKGEEIIVTYATICSGSDIINLSLQNLSTAIQERIGVKVVFQHVWACEWMEPKRKWIMENYSVPVVFGDICELMSDDGSLDYRSGKFKKPKPADIIIAGTSCKDASRMSSKQEASRDCVSKGSGSTGSTFVGLRDTVEVLKPSFVFLENVAGLLDKIKVKKGQRKPRYASNFTAIVENFRLMGYSFCHKIFNASDCMVAQRRERLYMCARLAKYDDDAPHEPEMQNLLQAKVRLNLNRLLDGAKQHLAHVRFEDFLLPKEITDNAHAAMKDWIPEGNGDAPEEEDTMGKKWIYYHEQEWADVSEAAKAVAFEKLRDNPWCENFCARKRDLLLLLYAKQAQQLEQPDVEVVWDLSQNPSRIPTAIDSIPCAMPKAQSQIMNSATSVIHFVYVYVQCKCNDKTRFADVAHQAKGLRADVDFTYEFL